MTDMTLEKAFNTVSKSMSAVIDVCSECQNIYRHCWHVYDGHTRRAIPRPSQVDQVTRELHLQQLVSLLQENRTGKSLQLNDHVTN